DRGGDVGGGLADLASVVQGDLGTVTGQGLAQGAQLEADLGLAGLSQARVTEGRQQRQVGIAGDLRLPELEGVLTEVVDGGPAAREVELGCSVGNRRGRLPGPE